MSLTRDDGEDICREIRNGINDLMSEIDTANSTIQEIRSRISAAEDKLIGLSVMLNGSNNPEFRRGVRLEIQESERIRDQNKQQLSEFEARVEDLTRQLNSLRDRALANGCA